MNSIQLAIIAAVLSLILMLVVYSWYQEIKFKRMVENNFNHKVNDAIKEDQVLILDGLDENAFNNKNILDRDIAQNKVNVDSLFADISNQQKPLVQEEIFPDDSVEAIFAKLKTIPFDYAHEADESLDYIIDIAFEEPLKLKTLPEIAAYTQKHYKIYVLGKDNKWQVYSRGNKYIASALKYVVHLVDKNGIVSQAQIANIYREIFKFVLQNSAFVQQSNYEASINSIQEQTKHFKEIKLELELYLILKSPVDYKTLHKFFIDHNFTEQEGKFIYIRNDRTQFMISDESANGLENGINYKLLLISSDLHFIQEPQKVTDYIFDFAEQFTNSFESRLLTTSKQIFSEREYTALSKYIINYIDNAKKKNIKLGGELISRMFS
ncbi:MAG: hypothetical protein LW807_05195 [Proteobacteria bacterium]|jgi:hypothetical protein|nr:hypothetical protein [Pseudomonadota bacterium]